MQVTRGWIGPARFQCIMDFVHPRGQTFHTCFHSSYLYVLQSCPAGISSAELMEWHTPLGTSCLRTFPLSEE